jgi:outer membrane protein
MNKKWNTDYWVVLPVLMLVSVNARADDMMSTYQLAAEQDQQYQAAISIYEAENARLGKARAGLLPFLGANADTTRRSQEVTSDDNITGFDGEADYNVDSWSVNFNQAIFDVPAWQLYKQAKVNLEKARLDLDSAKQELIYRVATVYGQALVAQENLRVSEAEKKALAEQLELDQERLNVGLGTVTLNVGLGTVTNLYATESRYSLAVSNAIEADFSLRDALVALKELTAQEPGKLLVIASDKPPLDPPSPNELDYWVESALKNNLDFLAAQRTVEIADREVSRIKAGHYPTLNLVASHSNSDADGSLTGSGRINENSDIGLQLGIPLVQGWGVVSGTREARALYQTALHKQEGVRRSVDRTSRSAYRAVTSGISRLQALNKAVRAGNSTLEARREGFKAGVNTNFEVLEAVRDLYSSERDYINAKYQFILSTLQLKRVTGSLEVADLERVNGWLE